MKALYMAKCGHKTPSYRLKINKRRNIFAVAILKMHFLREQFGMCF